MHLNKIFSLLLAAIFTLNGCSKNDNSNNNTNCPTPPDAPTLTSNSPVTAGQSLNLFADASGVAAFMWNGPNGFTSTTKNPVISPAVTGNTGNYNCFVIVDACTSSIGTISVVVNTPVAPCSPADNTSDYPLGIPDVSYYSISAAPDPIDGYYKITANGNNGDLDITFSTPNTPTPGTYRIVSYATSSFDLQPGDVRVTIVAGGTFSCFFSASQGNLYVTLTGGKVTATFCNLSFGTSQSCPDISSSSAKVIVE